MHTHLVFVENKNIYMYIFMDEANYLLFKQVLVFLICNKYSYIYYTNIYLITLKQQHQIILILLTCAYTETLGFSQKNV